MHYTIRPATRDDVTSIAKLYVDSIHTHFKGTLPDEELAMWQYEPEVRRLTRQIQEQSMTIWLLELETGELIGFIRFGEDEEQPGQGLLESIFVKDAYHGKGYGKLLFQEAQRGLKALGFDRMILWTPTKGKAHPFYKTLGGRKSGWKINEIGFDLTAYSWELGDC